MGSVCPWPERGLVQSRCRRLSLKPVQKVLLFHNIGMIASMAQPNRMWSGWLPTPSLQWLLLSDALRGSDLPPPGAAGFGGQPWTGEERPRPWSAGSRLSYRGGSRRGVGEAWAAQPCGRRRLPGGGGLCLCRAFPRSASTGRPSWLSRGVPRGQALWSLSLESI